MVIDTPSLVAMLTDEPESAQFEAAVDVDADQANVARLTYRRYGKGRHAASLNYGDCFSYSLAQVSGEPLLYKGDDFAHTDVAGVTH